MKTGTIGKIPRKECRDNRLFFTEDEKGGEQLQGEITDNDEKDKLIWDLKKALKGNAPGTPKQGPKRTSSAKSNALRGLQPPVDNDRKVPSRTRSAKSDRSEGTVSLVDGNFKQTPVKTRSRSLKPERVTRASTTNIAESAAPSSDGWAKPETLAPSKRSHSEKKKSVTGKQDLLTKPVPSSTGWSTPSTMASKRRGETNGA